MNLTASFRRLLIAALPIAALAAVSAGSALAQGQELGIEEILVTAQKRTQSMQDVPIAVSAFTGEQIEEAGVKDIRDIAGQTPGLQIQSKGETEVFVFIRGIGSVAPGIGADPAVGIYIDGLYAARGTNAAAAFFDVERVEVVKGPQGTLFGRNASSGAISIITRRPEIGESYGSALAGFGGEGQQKYELVYNASLSDSTALRFGIKHDSRDGLYENSLTGKDLNARDHSNARVSFLYDADGAYTSHFSAEYFDMSNTAAWVGAADSYADSVALNDPPTDQALESWRVNWTNDWDLSDALSLNSITGYYTHDVLVTPVDADLLDIFIIDFQEPQTADYFSQEFRLNGSSDAFDWFAGASYANEELSFLNDLRYEEFIVADVFELHGLDMGNGNACDGGIDFDGSGDVAVPVCLAPVSELPVGDGETQSIAVYGDLTWHLSDQVDLVAGIRHTRDDKTLTYNNPPSGGLLGGLDGQIFGAITPGPVTSNVEFTSTDPRIGINWNPNDAVMLYASAAKGYKSGGLNRQFDPVEQDIRSFAKEVNTAYEIGIKSTLFGGQGRLNAALFSNEYENFQLERILNGLPQVDNIGDIDVSGAEAEFRFLLSDAIELYGSLSVLDTEVTSSVDPALVGNDTPTAAETSGSLGARFTRPMGAGEFTATALWTYTGSFFWNIENTLVEPSFNTIYARAGWENDRWGVALVGENLTDEKYLANSFIFLDTTNIRAWGRLLRIEVNLNF